VLVLTALIPLLVFSAFVVQRDVELQRDALISGMQNTVRALSLAVDREVQTSLAVLQTLAASPALTSGDLRGFHELCVRAVETRKDAWIVLFDRSGQQLVNSTRPFGSPLPNPFRASAAPARDPRYPNVALGGAAPVRKVFETGRPVVSDLFVALDSRRPTIGVGIPIVRDGATAYVLEMSVDRDAVLRLLLDQHPPHEAVVSLLDRNGLIVARTADSARVVGLRLTSDLAMQAASADDGTGVGETLEGLPVYHAFTRSKLTGWTTSLAVPRATASASMHYSIMLLAGGGAAVVLLGLGAAFVVGKRIAIPISRLAGAAATMARGDRVELRASAVREVADLQSALLSAADAVRAGQAEREGRLVAEAKGVEAEEANRAKDEFLATLSHELRTPINAVYGWGHMLRSGQLNEAAKERALDAIIRNAHAQVQLIDDLLDVSRIITGTMRLDVRTVDLTTVVEAAVDSVRPAANAKDMRLQLVLDPRTGPIAGDPDRLQQVVWNLLTNSVKFTPKGGTVQIHLQRVNSHIEIVVSDTGQGIAPELLPVVFNRFWQAERSTTRAHGGLGLGLALVRHLVEAHGGTVTAHSEGDGTGATFVVKLPLALAKLDDGAARGEHPTARVVMPSHLGTALDGVRAVVVDDQKDALDLAVTILTSVGAEVRGCHSAAEALTAVREWRPDVLIADIEMPGEDGLSLIRRVRKLPPTEGGKLPAIALTAYGRVEDRVRTLSAGFSMHLPKPVEPVELTTVVASLTGREPPRRV
jgi:signal transduction histidine kinase/ActR/RegA family two-component response regulator